VAETKRKSSPKQVMDVQKSDAVASDATAKPVIVTNRQILRDPMVTNEATTPVTEVKSGAPSETEPAAETKVETIIAPVTEQPAGEQPKTEAAPEPEAKPEPEAEPAEPVPGEVTTDAAIEAAAEDAEAKREAELQKLIDKKQYFLKINAMEQRRAEQFIALGVVISIVLALVWLDVSLDAGLIHLGSIHPLTHFFSN
jgi:hypothetical protein